MAKVMKPLIDGYDNTDTGSTFYDGPPPPPGVYKGKIKQLAQATIATGDNKGGKRLHLVVEITEGKYKGAGLIHSLNITTQGAPFVNQFLRSLTDGSEEQWMGIRQAFWKVGYTVESEDAKGRLPITKIGKKFNPIGATTSFFTRMRTDNNGNERADIVRFIIPINSNGSEEDTDNAQDMLEDIEGETETALGDDLLNADFGETYEPSGMDEFSSEDENDPWS